MKKKFFSVIICFLLIFSFASCSDKDTASSSDAMVEELGLTADSKEASETTVEINSALYDLLDFEDDSEYQNAVKSSGHTLDEIVTLASMVEKEIKLPEGNKGRKNDRLGRNKNGKDDTDKEKFPTLKAEPCKAVSRKGAGDDR